MPSPYRHTYQFGPDFLSEIQSFIPRRYDPSVVVEHGVVVSTFDRHLARDPPSSSPGTDVDVPDVLAVTEELPPQAKPLVRSPVTGIVREVKAKPWGRVTIEDMSGYTHSLMHNENIVVRRGQWVRLGDPIGSLGRVAPPERNIKKDHSHNTVRRPNGEMVDETKLWYDSYTGQVLFDDDEWVARLSSAPEQQRLQQENDLHSLIDRFKELVRELTERFDRVNDKLDRESERREGLP